MGQVYGYECDYCRRFEPQPREKNGAAPPIAPDGWISVRPQVGEKNDKVIIVCSPECHLRLAAERMEAATGRSVTLRISKRNTEKVGADGSAVNIEKVCAVVPVTNQMLRDGNLTMSGTRR